MNRKPITVNVETARVIAANILIGRGYDWFPCEVRQAGEVLRMNSLMFHDERPDVAGALLCEFQYDMMTKFTAPMEGN